jgi:hypothetical protein
MKTIAPSNRIRIVLFLASTLAVPWPCAAKCPNVRYQISVHVLERATGAPVPGAQVSLVLPDYGSAPKSVEFVASSGTTDAAGSFSGEFDFNSYSGWFVVDRCRAKLTKLQVMVAAPNRAAERFESRRLHAATVATEDGPQRLSQITVRLSPPPQ